MEPVIEVRNLTFRYEDGTAALNGVDFDLFPGESVVLLGPNGSGKTTFVLHLNGLLSGEGLIKVCGLRVEKKNVALVRRKVGLLFQDPDEQLFMPTVLEDVAFGLLSLGAGAQEAAAEARAALERVGMAHVAGKAPYHLSAGEKRRIALAGVLVRRPEILILDEPTTYLDPPGQSDLLQLLTGLPQAKVVVTHDTLFARAIAGRAAFFEKGRIIASGPVEDIVRKFRWGPCPAAGLPLATRS